MTMFRARTIILATSLLVPLAAAAQQAPDWLVPGHEYFGHGVQDNGNGWTIHITVTGQDTARISYPSIPCAGVLDRGAGEGSVVVFIETITENVTNCISGGTVALEPLIPGALGYTWRNGPNLAEGTLVRLPSAKTS
jgi:hypothetical protein